MNAPRCPIHHKPMLYVGRVPAWENRQQQAHAWHCSKCTVEIQRPILPGDITPLPPASKPLSLITDH
jgi:hypothetical protein